MKEEIAQVEAKLLTGVDSSEERNMSWCRTCPNVSLLQLKKGKYGNDDIVLKERFLLQSGVPAL